MGLKELERIPPHSPWRVGHRVETLALQDLGRSRPLLAAPSDRSDSHHDEAWVRTVLAEAVEYLRRTFDYKVADPVANPNMIHDLFLLASGQIEKKHRKIACIVLKVMHVIQHMESRELLFKIAVSESELSQMVTERVLAVMDEGRQKGLPIVEFSDSVKARESIVTKLIAKRESTAAIVYDRTRFRVIVKQRDDIIPTLYFLTQRLLPFNFIVPSQTDNSLVRLQGPGRAVPQLQAVRAAPAPRSRLRGARGSRGQRLLGLDVQGPQLRGRRPRQARPVPPSARARRSTAQVPNRARDLRVPDRRREDGTGERAGRELARALQGAAANRRPQAPVSRPGRTQAPLVTESPRLTRRGRARAASRESAAPAPWRCARRGRRCCRAWRTPRSPAQAR